MAQFTEDQVRGLFESNLDEAKACLANLSFCCTKAPKFKGLSGWVFEQTMIYCLRKELKSRVIDATIQEQVSLGGRVTTDLLIAKLAIELKVAGLFDKKAPTRYRKYRVAAENKGYSYLYVTLHETYRPYREAMQDCLGNDGCFFLDISGDWSRLVDRIAQQVTNAKARIQG